MRYFINITTLALFAISHAFGLPKPQMESVDMTQGAGEHRN